jgi:HEAT repeat protein
MRTGRGAQALTFVVTLALVAGCTQSVNDLRAAGDVQGLVARLAPTSTAEERAEAATALGQLAAEQGPTSTASAEALDHLGLALGDTDPGVRAAAVLGLGGLGVSVAFAPIVGALDDDSAQVQGAAEQALTILVGDLDEGSAMDLLVDALDDTNATTRAAAATSLGEVGKQPAIRPLLTALDDSAAPVRTAAATALTAVLDRVPTGDAATALLDALRLGAESVRATAAEQLGKVGADSSIVPLLRAAGDPAEPVRSAASAALTAVLGRLSDDSAVLALLEPTGDTDKALRDAATKALKDLLARLGPGRAVSALNDANAGDSWLAVALGVPVSKVAAETRRLNLQLEPLDAITAAARKGGAIAGTHRYASSTAFHPAIVLAPSLVAPAHASWNPTAIRFLELVVNQKTSWQKLQVCPYYGPDITRYRAVVTVTVMSAYTGKIVATRTYNGSLPRACRSSEPYNLTRLEGGAPNLGPAVTWLQSLIHPPS